jgi:maltooligosyltrehalose trehalohydrolase
LLLREEQLETTRHAEGELMRSAGGRHGETRSDYRFGPLVEADRTTFRLFAPSAPGAEVIIEGRANAQMQRGDDGFLFAEVDGCTHGDRYKFKVGDLTFPDLASRQQDGDATGWSIVRAPFAPPERKTALRPWHETVICEVHVGAVTPEGTFAALTEKLEHFRDAGYTALEIMPINEFPGRRNWGYDGTLIFAPESAYGSPEDLRALVDRAHELGICLVLDVVYNHFGEVANYVRHYAPEWFDPEVKTPWGPGINFNNEMVRQFYYENARMWLSEYDFDGLRFDSVHEMKSEERDRFLGDLAKSCRGAKDHARLIIENLENRASWLDRTAATNEPINFTAQWNDDMHHVLAFLVSGEGKKLGYDDPAKDPYADLEKALADGFVHDGEQGHDNDGRERGGPASRLPPDCFVTYVENHDQIGNRADCRRLSGRIDPKRLDFCHFVKFLAPQIPLCFMGDEGNVRSPFPFFVDLPEDAARHKAEDRYRQMREMFKEDVADGGLPDPNETETFEMAKVRWDEYYNEERRAALERFRTLARLRREMVWPLTATPCLSSDSARQGNCLIVNWKFHAGTLSMAFNPTDTAMDIGCLICAAAVSTGGYSQHGEVLRLEPWSAVAWVR